MPVVAVAGPPGRVRKSIAARGGLEIGGEPDHVAGDEDEPLLGGITVRRGAEEELVGIGIGLEVPGGEREGAAGHLHPGIRRDVADPHRTAFDRDARVGARELDLDVHGEEAVVLDRELDLGALRGVEPAILIPLSIVEGEGALAERGRILDLEIGREGPVADDANVFHFDLGRGARVAPARGPRVEGEAAAERVVVAGIPVVQPVLDVGAAVGLLEPHSRMGDVVVGGHVLVDVPDEEPADHARRERQPGVEAARRPVLDEEVLVGERVAVRPQACHLRKALDRTQRAARRVVGELDRGHESKLRLRPGIEVRRPGAGVRPEDHPVAGEPGANRHDRPGAHHTRPAAVRLVEIGQSQIVAELVRENPDTPVLWVGHVLEDTHPVHLEIRLDDRPEMRMDVVGVSALLVAGTGMDDDDPVDRAVIVSRIRHAVRAVVVETAEVEPRVLHVCSAHRVLDHLPRVARIGAADAALPRAVVTVVLGHAMPARDLAGEIEGAEGVLAVVVAHAPRLHRARREEQPAVVIGDVRLAREIAVPGPVREVHEEDEDVHAAGAAGGAWGAHRAVKARARQLGVLSGKRAQLPAAGELVEDAGMGRHRRRRPRARHHEEQRARHEARRAGGRKTNHSHSMVAGGFEERS